MKEPKGFERPVSLEEAGKYAGLIKTEHKIELVDVSQSVHDSILEAYGTVLTEGVKHSPVEVAQLVDVSTGERLPLIIGNKGEIPMPLAEAQMRTNARYVMIHNHGTNASFSADDLYNTVKRDQIAMNVTLGHDGSVYEIVTQTEDLPLDRIRAEFDDILYEFTKDSKYSSINNTDIAEQILKSDVIEEICYRHGWRYSRRYYCE